MPNLKDPKSRISFMLYLGAIVVGVLFIMVIAIPVFSNPKFCNFCHSNSPDVKSWEKSSHANVTCYSCHMEGNIPYLLYEKVYAGVTGVYYETTGNYHLPINAESHLSVEFNSELCERCHNMEHREVTATKGMVMDHEIHAKKDIGCAVCHNRVAHEAMNNQEEDGVDYPIDKKTKDHEYMNGISHEGCFRCHTKKETELIEESHGSWEAPTKCSTCHNKDFHLPEGHGKNFRKTHGDLAKAKGEKSCLKCHDKEEFCGECHDAEHM
jgi:nitrate/TMAO reductase-like tetraheme cytochrome c subunit